MIPVSNPLDFSRAGTDGYSQGASIPVKWVETSDRGMVVYPAGVGDCYPDDAEYLAWLGFPRKNDQ